MPNSTKASRLVPAAVERQLTLSYLLVFALVLAAFGLAVHVACVTILEREAAARLDALVHVGASEVDWTRRGFNVDVGDEMMRSIDPDVEGIQWYRQSGTLAATYGLAAPRRALPPRSSAVVRTTASGMPMRTLTVTVSQPGEPAIHAFVRAALSEVPSAQTLRKVDLGILVGFLFSIFCSLIGGRLLTRQAMRRIEASMQTLAEFTADAAHELRGPLTAIATNAAVDGPDDCSTVSVDRERLRSIVSATNQMTHLTDDLLILARAGTSLEEDVFVVDLGAHVVRLADLYREEARRRQLRLDVDALSVHVYGNPDQIDRLLRNLIENAMRATPPGGTVSVKCRVDRTGSRVIIADTGVGIAAQNLDRVFERFWRGDASRAGDAGTGLGLAIARALARRHGGDIVACSLRGVGSEFIVSFPARPP